MTSTTTMTSDLLATHGSQSAVARAYGIPQPVLNRVLHGHQQPTPQLLRAIGWVKVVTYQPISCGNTTLAQY